MRIIEQHNSRPRELPGRRLPQKDNFRLGPHLFQVLISAENRNELRQQLPILDQPAAAVRDHLQNVAKDCKALAELIRKGPQPRVALASETSTNEVLKIFPLPTEAFEASDDLAREVVAFTVLLDKAAGWFQVMAGRVPRAKENRHTGKGALRMRAAEFLVDVFKRALGRP